MKSQPVIIIGIDGLDPSLVFRWKSELKNLAQIIDQGAGGDLASVFPPDSIPAWASIFTGKNPTDHGIIQYINYLSSKDLSVDFSGLAGNTFWDMAGDKGKKVCVINPFIAYPAWKVNGVMVSGPAFIKGPVLSYPPEIIKDYNIPPVLGGIAGFPSKSQLRDFIKQTRESIRSLKDIGLQLFAEDTYDLRFLTFFELDRIQHFFWRYHDEEDPTYPGKNPHQETIKDFYKIFDDIIGEFQQMAESCGAALMILSDHGHGRRCTKVLNINEILRRAGFLDAKGAGKKGFSPLVLIEKLKTGLLNFIYEHDLEDLLYKITPYIPYRKELKKSSFLISADDNLASADPDFGGTNPFGGIKINSRLINDKNLNYEEIRSKIIAELLSADIFAGDGKSVFKWVLRRDDVYSGDRLDLYPDILYELDGEFGTNWSLYGALTGVSTTHKKLSGGHKKEGALYIANVNRPVKRNNPSLLHIAPTVLNLLGVEPDIVYEKESLLA
ncbi:MAG: alkaline phosphatase family protein [bacterium]